MATKALDGSTIAAPCMGCGDVITYTLTLEHGSPEISPPGGCIAYKSGHLCIPCARKVERALALEPAEVTVVTYEHRHGLTRSAFRTQDAGWQAAATIAEEWATEAVATNPKLPRKITDLVIARRYREAVAEFNIALDDERIEVEALPIEERA